MALTFVNARPPTGLTSLKATGGCAVSVDRGGPALPAIVTLTANPSIDVSTSVERVEPVRKLRCSAGRRHAGGGGVNVARVARRLGASVRAVYPVGGPVGQLLRRLVDAEGLDSATVEIEGDTREDFTVVETRSGEEFRFVLPGPQLRESEWMGCLAALAALDPPDFVCASGSLPPGAPDDFYARAAAIAAGWKAPMALDASGQGLKAALAQPVHLIKPNLRELRDLTGAALEDRPAQVAACRDLLARSPLEVVALTLGSDGALLVTRDQVLRAASLPIVPASTVGAGDSFLGAMVWALASNLPLETAFRYGVAAGAGALRAPGTELCHADDVRRLVGQVVVEDITRPGPRAR